MISSPRRRANLLFYGLVAFLAAVSMTLLFRLMTDFERSLERRIADIQRVFSDPALLKFPDQLQFNFTALEELVAKYENQGEIREITITKRFGNKEWPVYPYFLPAYLANGTSAPPAMPAAIANPIPGEMDPQVRQYPLEARGSRLGTLLVRVNDSALKTVRGVVGALGLLFGISFVLFLLQFRHQEKTISRTTVELEQKRRQLMRLERLALAGQLSANVFHDLKKPVLNIRHEAEELGASDPSSMGIGQQIRKQVELFFDILREGGLDRFVRAPDDREYVDVNEMLERSLALVRYEQGDVEVRREYGAGLRPVLAEPVRLIQVFSNLVLNAYQAMQRNGTLSVSTTQQDGMVQVLIKDTGPGIPEGDRERIFEPFFSTKAPAEGTGLGLYIARDIIMEAKGFITVDSTANGTTFTVGLPCAKLSDA